MKAQENSPDNVQFCVKVTKDVMFSDEWNNAEMETLNVINDV